MIKNCGGIDIQILELELTDIFFSTNHIQVVLLDTSR